MDRPRSRDGGAGNPAGSLFLFHRDIVILCLGDLCSLVALERKTCRKSKLFSPETGCAKLSRGKHTEPRKRWNEDSFIALLDDQLRDARHEHLLTWNLITHFPTQKSPDA